MKSGLRIDARKLVNKIQKNLGRVQASDFRPELMRHTRRVLATAIKETPLRNESVIRSAQGFQYDARVDYIPSVHELVDPSLVVKEDVYWLYANGQWWAASYRELPDEINEILNELITERDRRLTTSVSSFVAERAQARFLYHKSWWQVSESVGAGLSVDSSISSAHSRPYHLPSGEPPRAYGQVRGGKHVLSVVVYNPFLDTPTKYWRKVSGKQILSAAEKTNHSQFIREVNQKMGRFLAGAR